MRVRALIWVESDSQKGIVIGAQGRMIKAIGTAARRELRARARRAGASRPVGARAARLARRRGAARPPRYHLGGRPPCSVLRYRLVAPCQTAHRPRSSRLAIAARAREVELAPPHERDARRPRSCGGADARAGCAGSARGRGRSAARTAESITAWRSSGAVSCVVATALRGARSTPLGVHRCSSGASRRSSAAVKRRGSSALTIDRLQVAAELRRAGRPASSSVSVTAISVPSATAR